MYVAPRQEVHARTAFAEKERKGRAHPCHQITFVWESLSFLLPSFLSFLLTILHPRTIGGVRVTNECHFVPFAAATLALSAAATLLSPSHPSL